MQKDLRALYEPINEIQIIKNYLNLAQKYQSNVHLWLKGKTFYTKTKIEALDHSSGSYVISIPKQIKQDVFDSHMRESGMVTFFSFKIDELIFFWKTKFMGSSGSHARYEIPDQLFKLQRRKNLRVKFIRARPFGVIYEPPHDLLEFLHKFEAYKNEDFLKLYSAKYVEDKKTYRIVKEAYDLSAGGIGLTVNGDESRFYREETILHNIQFKIGNETYKLNGEIRYKNEYKEMETYIVNPLVNSDDFGPSGIIENTGSFTTKDKIGVMFLNVDVKSDKEIAKFVYEENRKIFSLIL